MAWYFSGNKTIEKIRPFQANRPNLGNAPAMRSVALRLINKEDLYKFCEINARATHPNKMEILSSQIVAFSYHFVIKVKKILNFDYPTASGWSIHQNFSNLKVGIRIFFVIRRFYAKTSFYDSDASIGEFKY
jgi:hypothetical protein